MRELDRQACGRNGPERLLELGRALERQEVAQLPGKAADGLAETLVAKGAANGAADRCAILLQQVAEESLWRKLLPERLLLELRQGLLLEQMLQDRELLQLLLGQLKLIEHRELRRALERQQTAETTRDVADALTDARLTEQAADSPARRATILLQQVAEEALRLELGRALERQEVAELTRDVADALTDARLAEQAADGATGGAAVLLQQVAEEALRLELLAEPLLLLLLEMCPPRKPRGALEGL